jgi:hypothetical protein
MPGSFFDTLTTMMRDTVWFIVYKIKRSAIVFTTPGLLFRKLQFVSQINSCSFTPNAIARPTLWYDIPAGSKVLEIINVIVGFQKVPKANTSMTGKQI